MEDQGKDFDPYAQWLKIPPEHQPPDHYTLLGLEQFTDDAESIDKAAKRRSAYLHQLASGPNRKAVQQLLGEIATARRTLVNQAAKQKYDEALKNPPPAPPQRGSAVSSGPAIQIAVDAGSTRKPARRKRADASEDKPGIASLNPVYLLTAFSLVCAVVYIGYAMYSNSGHRRVASAPSASVPTARELKSKRTRTLNSLANRSRPQSLSRQSLNPRTSKEPQAKTSKPQSTKRMPKPTKSVSESTTVAVEIPDGWIEQLPLISDFSDSDEHPFDKTKFLSDRVDFKDGHLVIVPSKKQTAVISQWMPGRKLELGNAVSLRTNFPVGRYRKICMGLVAGGVAFEFRCEQIEEGDMLVLRADKELLATFLKFGQGDLMLTVYRPPSVTDELQWFVSFRNERYGGRLRVKSISDSNEIGLTYISPEEPLYAPLWVDDVRLGPLSDPPDLSAAQPVVLSGE